MHRQPLVNIEAEQALLGLLMARNDQLLTVLDVLTPEGFSEPLHQRLSAAMLRHQAVGRGFSLLTLKSEMASDAVLSELGGVGYLSGLVTASIPVLHPRQLAEDLADLAAKRALAQACQETLEALEVETGKSAHELAADVQASVTAVTEMAGEPLFESARAVTMRVLDGLKDPQPCYSTGIPLLDNSMGGGLYAKKTYAFCAVSKIGKAVLAGTISHALCLQRVPHLFIALEMDNEELEQRRMARTAEVKPAEFLKDAKLGGAAWSPAIAFAEEYGDYCLYRRSPGGITFSQLAHTLTAAVHRAKVQGVILDYWQLVDGQGAQQSKSDHLEKVAQWLATFCRRHRLFSVVNVQLNDDGSTFASRGIRRAVDQRYTLKRIGQPGD